VIADTLQSKEVDLLSTTTELAQLHELIGGLRRCVTSLASRYGDTPAMRRIVNDAERILNDIDRLDIDAEELELSRGTSHHHHVGEKIAIPDTQYDTTFWGEVDDGGVAG
jgi:nitrogen-specific signal transduction histidine kinase